MTSTPERGLWLTDSAARANLGAFVERARRLDDAVVIRLCQRSADALVAWAATGFDVLASRVVKGTVRPADICADADALLRGLSAVDPSDSVDSGYVDPGFAMDSAWRGVLPPDSGFVHVDDVPASAVLALADRGAEVSKEQGSQGPPVSLLDQEVIHVSGSGVRVGIPMRCIFALTAMGFVGDLPEEVVRVRTVGVWLRIDARYGSVYRRRDLLRLV
ncbi:MAG: hypothetical protein QOH60_2107 [Mycobacterium sp.]|jgi:hypothetical protein|nr:hypothetical protein [Mycobacterium sp.]